MLEFDVLADFGTAIRQRHEGMGVLPFGGWPRSLDIGEAVVRHAAMNRLPPQGQGTYPERELLHRSVGKRLDRPQLHDRRRGCELLERGRIAVEVTHGSQRSIDDERVVKNRHASILGQPKTIADPDG